MKKDDYSVIDAQNVLNTTCKGLKNANVGQNLYKKVKTMENRLSALMFILHKENMVILDVINKLFVSKERQNGIEEKIKECDEVFNDILEGKYNGK